MTYTPPHGWTCFHCGMTFHKPEDAREHFGADASWEPACLDRLKHTDQEILDRARRAEEAEQHAEKLRAEAEAEAEQVHLHLASLGTYFPGCRYIHEAFHLYDTMEGRALAAEATLAVLQWLAPDLVVTARQIACGDKKL